MAENTPRGSVKAARRTKCPFSPHPGALLQTDGWSFGQFLPNLTRFNVTADWPLSCGSNNDPRLRSRFRRIESCWMDGVLHSPLARCGNGRRCSIPREKSLAKRAGVDYTLPSTTKCLSECRQGEFGLTGCVTSMLSFRGRRRLHRAQRRHAEARTFQQNPLRIHKILITNFVLL